MYEQYFRNCWLRGIKEEQVFPITFDAYPIETLNARIYVDKTYKEMKWFTSLLTVSMTRSSIKNNVINRYWYTNKNYSSPSPDSLVSNLVGIYLLKLKFSRPRS